MKKRYVEIITVEKVPFLLHFLPHIFFVFIVVKLITRRSEVQVLPPQPCCATKKDIAPENPDTTTVSGFFRAPIFKCKQKDIFLC